jgi:hypothetical protein
LKKSFLECQKSVQIINSVLVLLKKIIPKVSPKLSQRLIFGWYEATNIEIGMKLVQG